ncbi:MAG: VWA domain-containing protein [Planctomycetaceae bacterium]
MSFANPWGLLALAALPTIAAIHLFHRRYPRLPVAGLHLWGVARMTHTPGRRRERLPITATLILELLAALVLALALARPQVDSFDRAIHLVAVLDGSASMSADRLTAAGPARTFRELAIEELERRLKELPQGSAVTLIESGRRPALLFGPQGHPAEVSAALEQWSPQAVQHDFQPAWDLADQLAEASGRLIFLTDTIPDSERANLPTRFAVVSVGEPQPNLAITAARWTRPEDKTAAGAMGEITLRLVNLGRRDTTGTVTATAVNGQQDQPVFRRTVELAAGRSQPLQVSVPPGLGEIDIRVSGLRDALELDSRVRLVEPVARTVAVAMTLPADSIARQQLNRALVTLSGWRAVGSGEADLVIARVADLATGSSDQWWLGVGPVDEDPAARKRAVDLSDRSAYVLEKRHPLLDGVVLGGVIWGGVQDLAFEHTPLITSGSRSLLARKLDTRSTVFVLNIDLARSNLPDTPDWPILISNLLEECRDSRPGLRRVNYRVSENVRFRIDDRAADGDKLLQLEGGGRRRQVARGRLVEITGLTRSGLYTLTDGDRRLARFAVNFQDPVESSLVSLTAGERAAAVPMVTTGFRIDSPYTWLILLGILTVIGLAVADWQVLRQGAGVTAGPLSEPRFLKSS